MSNVEVFERPLEQAVSVNSTIVEFTEPLGKAAFEARIQGKVNLVLIGQIEGKPAGYIVSYEDDRYPNAFYVWMGGVDPQFRGMGVLKAMMHYQEIWAKEKGYEKLVLKTRNGRREMLSYLAGNGFNFTEVIPKGKIEDTEILTEKVII